MVDYRDNQPLLSLTKFALNTQRTIVQPYLKVYPVLTLPNEIISEIFLRYIPPYPMCPFLVGENSPTKLGHICRLWRHIAHETPQLWRAIYLTDCGFFPSVDGVLLETARIWLARSRSVPLSIVANFYAFPQAAREPALALLLSHRWRWEHAALNFVREGTGGFRDLLDGDAPYLRELDVRVTGLESHSRPLQAPKLRTVIIRADNLPLDDMRAYLPWEQLTSLFLAQVAPSTVAAILHSAERLIDCRLSLASYTDPGTSSSIVQAHLKTLILQSHRLEFISRKSGGIIRLLQLLRAPSLERLYVEQSLLDGGSPPRAELLAKLVEIMGCSRLAELHVAGPDTAFKDYKQAFPNIPRSRIFITSGSRLVGLPVTSGVCGLFATYPPRDTA